MKQDLKEKWIQDLESGKYKQGTGRLYNPENNSFCCLGILAKVCNMQIDEERDGIREYGEFEDYTPLRNLIGDNQADTLIEMNDTGRTFIEIAKYIKTHV